MNKILLSLILCFLVTQVSAQRFAQYYTNTLYDSFENPSQKVFTPDSSRMFAFNFLFPNLSLNAYITGSAQPTIKQGIFLGKSNNPNLMFGQNSANRLYTVDNVYIGMFKVYTSLKGDQEIGFSWQTKGEGNARFTDETVGLFNGNSSFTNTNYHDVANDNYWYQGYHQLSITYRETLNNQFSVGLKLSALSGIVHEDASITHSNVTFDKPHNQLDLTLAGHNRTTYDPGTFGAANFIPDFRSPGLSFSLGVGQHTDGGINLQYNLKDLGFIRWSANSNVHNFNNTQMVTGVNANGSSGDLYKVALKILTDRGVKQSFITPTDGRFEVSVSKTFGLNDDGDFKYIPVLIASKQLFYNGLTGVFTNNIQYRSLMIGVTQTVDDTGYNLGGQLMIKSPNFEFFIGSEQILHDYSVLLDLRKDNAEINKASAAIGAGFYIGFSIKFGHEIETHENASHISTGDDEGGLLRRLLHGVF
jgi:Family of unknown function (DUF5723)